MTSNSKHRDIVVAALKHAAPYIRMFKRKTFVIKAGGVVNTLTAEQRQAWVDALKPVWKKFEDNIGTDMLDAALKSNKG